MKSQIKSGKTFDHGSITVLKNGVKLVSTTGETYDIGFTDIPDYCHLPKAGKRIDAASYSLNTQGTMLYSVHPWNGKFFAEFVKIQAKDNELPRWRIQPGGPRTGKDGRSWMAEDKAVFTVICRITSGDFEGCEFAMNLDYLFQSDKSGFAEIVGRSKSVVALQEALALFGLDLETLQIRNTDNILPDLEEAILSIKNPPTFEADFENGWPTLSELPVGMAAPKRTPAPKKAAAKAPAKSEPAPKTGRRTAKKTADDDDSEIPF